MSARKPCAACSHGKSLHRRHECRATWQTRGATFMGISIITKWCTCAGYVDGGKGATSDETRPAPLPAARPRP